jgi:hypothetical protein
MSFATRIGWLLALAVGAGAGCGGSQVEPELPPRTQATVVHADQSSGKPGEKKGGEPVVIEAVAGVDRIEPARFVDFIGFHKGDGADAVTALMPEELPRLGKRSPFELSGSEGFRFDHHLAISWATGSKKIDYISVRSRAALDYLANNGRSDAKLTSLFGATIGEAKGALGEPTLDATRPHAITYRYEFTAGGGRGTVTLEFSKLDDPPRCRAISVHWLN